MAPRIGVVSDIGQEVEEGPEFGRAGAQGRDDVVQMRADGGHGLGEARIAAARQSRQQRGGGVLRGGSQHMALTVDHQRASLPAITVPQGRAALMICGDVI